MNLLAGGRPEKCQGAAWPKGKYRRHAKGRRRPGLRPGLRPAPGLLVTALRDPGLSAEEVIGAQGHHPSQDGRTLSSRQRCPTWQAGDRLSEPPVTPGAKCPWGRESPDNLNGGKKGQRPTLCVGRDPRDFLPGNLREPWAAWEDSDKHHLIRGPKSLYYN